MLGACPAGGHGLLLFCHLQSPSGEPSPVAQTCSGKYYEHQVQQCTRSIPSKLQSQHVVGRVDTYHRSFVPDKQAMIALMRRAVDLGVNLFDTAAAYGP